MPDAESGRPNVAEELGRLKDFQRLSVDAVFRRLYQDPTPARRFLIADEVGLGKTLVARGVIARAIDHLWGTVHRIDVVYLCSNADIARQNVRRLTPNGVSGVSLMSRITLLPLQTHDLKQRKVNIIALTPGTSLDLKTSPGIRRERALLLRMLAPHWNLDWTGACRVFARPAGLRAFRSYAHSFEKEHSIDPCLSAAFLAAADASAAESLARGEPGIRQRLGALINDYLAGARSTKGLNRERTAVIGDLRQLLAASCIRALQPDLIILDEFQRFKELLDGKGAAGETARHLFEYRDESTEAKVLLLSATPYKMYTVQDEDGNEDHYADFLRTARFLFADDRQSAEMLGHQLQAYRRALLRLGQGGTDELIVARDSIEALLRSVMVRTERLAVTRDRSGMLVEKQIGPMHVRPDDAREYARVQAIARFVDQGDTLPYWKAAPWLLNFMDDYKLRDEVDTLIETRPQPAEFIAAMKHALPSLLRYPDVKAFKRLEPSHARLRWLLESALDGGLWKLLWLPPTLPYHGLGDPYQAVARESPTKYLLFSAWRLVPRVVAAALSHDAESRMYAAFERGGGDLGDAPERYGDQLRIARRDHRATGLTVLAFLYPSVWMARNCDPMMLSAAFVRQHGRAPTVEELLIEAEDVIRPAVETLTGNRRERPLPDEAWYWAAPILLDGAEAAAWSERELVALWETRESRRQDSDDEDEEEGVDDRDARSTRADGDDSGALGDLVARVRTTAGGSAPAGSAPKDLIRTLALIGIAGPATVALRAFGRVAGDSALSNPAARDAAARVGASFRTLFNQPDSTAIVRATTGPNDYWAQCLEYSTNGCLQAVMDEYAHLLVSEAGVFGKGTDEIVSAIAATIVTAVSLRRARVGAKHIALQNGSIYSNTVAFRSRFAMRFGEERSDESGEKVRADDVRKAFNSPFWPFVLATTSVGQEGLDFHLYCHRVVHWSLPPNPVDLEQREGRVHRFKGHAIRKNVALEHGDSWIQLDGSDPWEETFEAAVRARPREANDLVPYWVYPVEGGAAIERHVPIYPLSREVERLEALRESLALYRMVFGQPRQDELLSYLSRVVPRENIPQLAEQLRISLAPQR